jgi:hypothetical protein
MLDIRDMKMGLYFLKLGLEFESVSVKAGDKEAFQRGEITKILSRMKIL